MIIKVTRSAAIAALLRGETVWSSCGEEGRSFDAPASLSKRYVRRFLSHLQRIDSEFWKDGFYLIRQDHWRLTTPISF